MYYFLVLHAYVRYWHSVTIEPQGCIREDTWRLLHKQASDVCFGTLHPRQTVWTSQYSQLHCYQDTLLNFKFALAPTKLCVGQCRFQTGVTTEPAQTKHRGVSCHIKSQDRPRQVGGTVLAGFAIRRDFHTGLRMQQSVIIQLRGGFSCKSKVLLATPTYITCKTGARQDID